MFGGLFPRWSFEAAVLKANRSSGHDHPQGSFDDEFLQGRAVPILARFLDGPISPDPDELAEAWVQQLQVQPEMGLSLKRQAIPMATRYLLRLEEELHAHRTGLESR